MRDISLINKRNEKIFKEYCEMWASGLRDELIVEKLSNTYFLSLKTIKDILLLMRSKS